MTTVNDGKLGFPPLIRQLLNPAAWPHPVRDIQVIETHISWVLLTGDYAYKIKKPVTLGFLDFSTLAARRRYCGEELRVNRRTAPEIYLGVVPIAASADGVRVVSRRSSTRCGCGSSRTRPGWTAASGVAS